MAIINISSIRTQATAMWQSLMPSVTATRYYTNMGCFMSNKVTYHPRFTSRSLGKNSKLLAEGTRHNSRKNKSHFCMKLAVCIIHFVIPLSNFDAYRNYINKRHESKKFTADLIDVKIMNF